MTTSYFVSYQIRKMDGTTALLKSPLFPTECDARVLYRAKLNHNHVLSARLWKHEHYEPKELTPKAADNYPSGKNYDRILCEYQRF